MSRLTRLLEWFDDQRVWYDTTRIQVVEVDGGLGVMARDSLDSGHTVVKIPRSVVLSVESSALANLFHDEHLRGHNALVLAVMFEFAQGDASPWYGYLQSLPPRVYLPVFWTQDELAYLGGTELGETNFMEYDYAQIVAVLTKYPALFSDRTKFTLDEYKRVSSLVSSRAFRVDDYHKDAMVPFADLFNHQTCREHVHVEFDHAVCKVCGSAGLCDHRSISSVSDDQEDNGSESTDGWDVLEMNVVRPCIATDQVYNTYGEHPNSYLLSRYGFAEVDNPCDAVAIDSTIIKRTLLTVINKAQFNQRTKWFLKNLELFSIDDKDDFLSRCFSVYRRDMAEPELLQYLVVCLMDDTEFKRLYMLKKTMLTRINTCVQAIQDGAIELVPGVANVLLSAIDARLHLYLPHTTLQADMDKLGTLDGAYRWAWMCRASEKHILNMCREAYTLMSGQNKRLKGDA